AARMNLLRISREECANAVRHIEACGRVNVDRSAAGDEVLCKLWAGGVEHAEAARPPARAFVDVSAEVEEGVDHLAIFFVHGSNDGGSIETVVRQRLIDARLQRWIARKYVANELGIIGFDRCGESFDRVGGCHFDMKLE